MQSERPKPLISVFLRNLSSPGFLNSCSLFTFLSHWLLNYFSFIIVTSWQHLEFVAAAVLWSHRALGGPRQISGVFLQGLMRLRAESEVWAALCLAVFAENPSHIQRHGRGWTLAIFLLFLKIFIFCFIFDGSKRITFWHFHLWQWHRIPES